MTDASYLYMVVLCLFFDPLYFLIPSLRDNVTRTSKIRRLGVVSLHLTLLSPSFLLPSLPFVADFWYSPCEKLVFSSMQMVFSFFLVCFGLVWFGLFSLFYLFISMGGISGVWYMWFIPVWPFQCRYTFFPPCFTFSPWNMRWFRSGFDFGLLTWRLIDALYCKFMFSFPL